MMPCYYFDNAATTKIDDEVLAAYKAKLEELYVRPRTFHEEQILKHATLSEAKELFLRLFSDERRIIFTSGGTESNNLALFGTKHLGNHLVTTRIEHPSVLETAKALESEGMNVTLVNVDKEGFVLEEELRAAVSKETHLVSIIHANNEIGTVQDITRLTKIIKEENPNALIHIDATQSFTKTPLPDADLITICAHKMHGPKGVGALIIKKHVDLHTLFEDDDDKDVAGIYAFSVAIRQDPELLRISSMQERLIQELLKHKHIELNGSLAGKKRLCNNISICMHGIEAEIMMRHLEQDGIFVSAGAACSATKKKPSHVLLAIGRSEKQARSTLRISLSKFNTNNEIDLFLERFNRYYQELLRLH